MFNDRFLFDMPASPMSGKEKLEELCGIHWGSSFKGEMKNDKGERTNRKIKDQPFYHRQNNGKMKPF